MKYKAGDKTLLGEIVSFCPEDNCYYVNTIGDDPDYYFGFSESEIDAIIVKPKRNIERVVELYNAGKKPQAMSELKNHMPRCNFDDYMWMMEIPPEPSPYPKLTPEELRAVKWLVDGGYETLSKRTADYTLHKSDGTILAYVTEASMPMVKQFESSAWIASKPINLRELLAAQEEISKDVG